MPADQAVDPAAPVWGEPSPSALAHGQNVPVGILEPGDPRPAGSGPDASVVLLEPLEAFEDHAPPPQLPHGPGDVPHLPPEGCERMRAERLDLLDPEHRRSAVCGDGQRKTVVR